jgi:2-oxoglutarate dehydrogenase E2 component (dihydrolipoamide succinyltransferase)
MRRSIASNMARSLAAAPHVTSVFEADMSAILADREARKAATGAAPTVTAYVVTAVVTALSRVPEVNSRWHEDAVEIFEDVNIGVGVATPDGGLIAPVIHGAQHLSLEAIHARLDDVTVRARAGTLSQADVSGGTFMGSAAACWRRPSSSRSRRRRCWAWVPCSGGRWCGSSMAPKPLWSGPWCM